jgi:hypothetical protein
VPVTPGRALIFFGRSFRGQVVDLDPPTAMQRITIGDAMLLKIRARAAKRYEMGERPRILALAVSHWAGSDDLYLSMVGGDLILRDLPALNFLSIHASTVGGDVRIEGTGVEAIGSYDCEYPLPDEIGGDLVITDNPALGELWIPTTLTRVEGSLVYRNNAAELDISPHVPEPEASWSVGGDMSVEHVHASDLQWPYLQEVGGDLRIEANGLVGFYSLSSVGGSIQVTNASDEDVDTLYPDHPYTWVSFELLDSLGGDLAFTDCTKPMASFPNLAEISGSLVFSGARHWENDSSYMSFPSLSNIGEYLSLVDVGDVEDFGAFPSLRSVGVVYVYGVPALTTLNGLENLESGGLSISEAPLLRDLGALSALREPDGLSLQGVPSLETLGDFRPRRIGGPLSIYETGLTSLAGLEDLTEVTGSLHVGQHWGWSPSLTDLSALGALDRVGGSVSLHGAFTCDDAEALVAGIDYIGGSTDISECVE